MKIYAHKYIKKKNRKRSVFININDTFLNFFIYAYFIYFSSEGKCKMFLLYLKHHQNIVSFKNKHSNNIGYNILFTYKKEPHKGGNSQY